MRCVIELGSGKELELDDIPTSWTWEDLFDALFDQGAISQIDLDELESAVDLEDAVGTRLSLNKSQSASLKNQSSLITDDVEHEQNSSKPSRTGLKRKLKRTNKNSTKSTPNTIPKATEIPIPKPSVGGGLKRKVKPEKPAFTTSLTFTMPLKCSRNGADWQATLISQHKPIKSDLTNSNSAPSAKFGGSIHLVLDDSISMGGEPNRQLISAAQGFLADRPSKEHIVLHTFNDSLSGEGTPAKISKIVAKLLCPGYTPMCGCLRRVSETVSKGDVIIFFTDGDSGDGDPSDIVSDIKSKGVRFISIGCGSDITDEDLLMRLATSRDDYHHAKNASDILQAFQAVAKSLGQQRITQSSSGSKSGSNITARQIQSQPGSPASSPSGGTSMGVSVLGYGEGYEYIEDFNCHHCASNERIACGYCAKNMCSGGSTLKGKVNVIQCPYCNEESEIEMTQQGVHAGVGQLGGKGKK